MFNAFGFSALPPNDAGAGEAVARGFDTTALQGGGLPVMGDDALTYESEWLYEQHTIDDVVRIYDARDLSSIAQVGTAPCIDPWRSDVQGDLLACTGRGEVRLHDITDRTAPQQLFSASGAEYDDPKPLLAGTWLYVGSGSNYFYTYDISDPASPQLLSSYYAYSEVEEIAVDTEKKVAYLLSTGRWIEVVDLSDPAAPSRLDLIRPSSAIRHYAYLDGHIVLVERKGGDDFALSIYDISDPSAITRIHNFSAAALFPDNEHGLLRAVAYQSPYLLVSLETDTIDRGYEETYVLDLSDASQPEIAFASMHEDVGKSGVVVRQILPMGGSEFLVVFEDGDHLTLTIPGVNAPSVRARSMTATQAKADVAEFGSVSADEGARLMGGQERSYRSVAADATVKAGDYYVGVSDTSAPRTLTLATPLGRRRIHIIKDESGAASANPITVDGSGALIDGQATAQIATDYGSLSLISNGTNWHISSRS